MSIASPGVRHRSLCSTSPNTGSPSFATKMENSDYSSPRQKNSSSPHRSSARRPSPHHYTDRSPYHELTRLRKKSHWRKLFRSRRWSPTTLVIMILILSLLSSILVSTVSMWWWGRTGYSYFDTVRTTSSGSTLQSLLRGDAGLHRSITHVEISRRIYFLEGDIAAEPNWNATGTTDETMMYSTSLNEDDIHDGWQPIDYEKSRCQPLAKWQIQFFPNCNSIHEISLHAAATTRPLKEEKEVDERLGILGSGWFRTTWQLDRRYVDSEPQEEATVLKTLRMEREYKREYYELHRRDAVAMERLTSSPFVVNVYGACGNSAINELADFPFEGVQSLEVFNRRLRGRDSPEVYQLKLRMAASLAVGVADIHGIDWDALERPTMAHYDVNPRNVALFKGGRPKLNDFNIAEFLHYDPSTNKTCGFKSRLHEPWWRAPEEMNTEDEVFVDEKVDVYALGNILFHTLTTHSPRGKMKKERMEEVRSVVREGIPPKFPPPYDTSSDPAAVVLRKAISMCFEMDAEKRATSQEVADLLMDALVAQQTREETSPQQQTLPAENDEEAGDDDSGSTIEAKD